MNGTSPEAFSAQLERHRIVVVLRAGFYMNVRRCTEVLVESGLPIIEFTITTPDALDAVTEARRVEGAIVGLGSVTDRVQARRAVSAGSQFLVSPVTATALMDDNSVPTVLAGFTPTEILTAHRATGLPVKVFPANAAGGPSYISALRATLPDVPLMPSGGVDADNIRQYLAAGAVAVNVGSSLASADVIERGDTAALSSAARNLVGSLDRDGTHL